MQRSIDHKSSLSVGDVETRDRGMMANLLCNIMGSGTILMRPFASIELSKDGIIWFFNTLEFIVNGWSNCRIFDA